MDWYFLALFAASVLVHVAGGVIVVAILFGFPVAWWGAVAGLLPFVYTRFW